jgi:O-antigen/teichoic acid export membrane protein
VNSRLREYDISAVPRSTGRLRGLSLRWAALTRSHGQHVSNVASYFVSRIVSVLLFVAPVPLFIKRHGEADYGVLTLALLIFSYLHMFDLGIGYAVNMRFSRALARGNKRASNVLSSAIPLYIVCVVLVGLALVLYAEPLSNIAFGTSKHASVLRILAGCVFFLLLSALMYAVLQAYNRVSWINYSRTILDVAKALGLTIGSFTTAGIETALLIVLVGTAVKATVDFLLVVRLLGGASALVPRWHLKGLFVNIGFGLPMMLSTALTILLTSVDKIFVLRALGSSALAYYSIGADLCMKVCFIVWSLSGSFYTVLLRRYATRGDVSRLFRLSIAVVIVVAVLFCLPLALFARQVLSLWLGADFAAHAAGATRFYAVAAVVYLFGCVYQNFIQTSGYPRVLLAGSLVAAGVLAVGLYVVSRSALGVDNVAVVMIMTFGAQTAFLAAAKHLFLSRVPRPAWRQ